MFLPSCHYPEIGHCLALLFAQFSTLLPPSTGSTKFHSGGVLSLLPSRLDRHLCRAKIAIKARTGKEAGAAPGGRGRTFDPGKASPNGTETKDQRQYRKFYLSNIESNDRESREDSIFRLPSLPNGFSLFQNFFFLAADTREEGGGRVRRVLREAKNNQGRQRRNGKWEIRKAIRFPANKERHLPPQQADQESPSIESRFLDGLNFSQVRGAQRVQFSLGFPWPAPTSENPTYASFKRRSTGSTWIKLVSP